MNYQDCLQRLVTDSYRDKEEATQLLVELADSYWHKHAQFSLDGFEGACLQKAAYLLELLTGLSTSLDQVQKLEAENALKQALHKFKVFESITFYYADKPSRFGFDDVASKWGLTAGASPRKVPGLLDLQRRSYAPSQNAAA